MLRFWQVIAAILIFYLGQLLLARSATAPSEFGLAEWGLILLIWALVSALVWVGSYFIFRAVDRATSEDRPIDE
jgi:hypothetical protein